jgi:putative RNA 2'-phosphotransferase
VDRDAVRLSKRMSRVLRHAPESAGIVLDPQGWVAVDDLVRALGTTRERLDAVVRGNDKQRFAVEPGPDGRDRIRASQGHSARVGVELGLPSTVPPQRLFHGTQRAFLPAIREQGLRPGRRQHVHLSPDQATAQAVSWRRGRTGSVILGVRSGAMAADGLLFYRSANGVWLTDAVPPSYLDLPAPGRPE